MATARRERALDYVLTAALVAAFVLNALYSSGSIRVDNAVQDVRWVAVGLVAVVAGAMVVRRRASIALQPHHVAAAALVAVAFASTAWTVSRETTFQRGTAFALVVLAASLTALAVAARPDAQTLLLGAVLLAAGAMAVAGFVLVAIDYDAATQSAEVSRGFARYRGITENPNAVALLAALTLPIAAAFALSDTRTPTRVAAAAAAVALATSIVAAQAHGMLVAACVGLLASAFLARARRAVAAAAVVIVALLAAAVVERATSDPPAPVVPRAGALHQRVVDGHTIDVVQEVPSLPAQAVDPPALANEVAGYDVGGISLGRADAWIGGLDQASDRPLTGFGFATEGGVFIDRFARFQGSFVENSFVGLVLQLGVIGFALFSVFVVAAASAGVRRARAERGAIAVAASGGVLAAGLAAGITQSFLVAAGNIVSPLLWLCAFLFGGTGVTAAGGRRPGRARAAAVAVALGVAAAVAAGVVERDRFTKSQQEGLVRMRELAGRDLDNGRLSAVRVTAQFDCFLYRSGRDLFGIEICFDRTGDLVDAVDRRRRDDPRFWSLRFDERAAPQREDPGRIRALLERVGAIDWAATYAGGYPPSTLGVDSGPLLVDTSSPSSSR